VNTTKKPEIRLKQWIMEEAERRGVSSGTIRRWYDDGKYPNLKVEKVTKRIHVVHLDTAYTDETIPN